MKHLRLVTGGVCALAAGVLVAMTASQSMADDDSRSNRVSGRQCVSSPLDDSKVIDRETLMLTDRSGNAVLLHMTGPCLRKNEPVGLEFFGSARVCSPLDVTVTGDITSAVPMRCMISSVEALTKEQVKEYNNKR